MRRHRLKPSDGYTTPEPIDPDQAWKALSLVNDWVKHAEVKLGVVLATTGVSGGVLFNLVKNQEHASQALDAASVISGTSVLAAGVCAMIGLYPRVTLQRRTSDGGDNPLYFEDIARLHKDDAPSYGVSLHMLIANPNDLVQHLGQQIHANATVAQRKYRWANRAIRALLLGLLALGAVATIIALKK